MTMRLLSFLILFSIANCSYSQNAKEDFARINKTYDKSKFSIKIKYEVFKNHSTKSVFQVEQGEVKKNMDSKYYRIGNIETIQNNEYALIVDHEDKNISLLPKKLVVEEKMNEKLYLGNLDQILELCDKTEFSTVNETQNSYTLSFSNSEYKQINIIYNKKTFALEKLVLYFLNEENLEDSEGGVKETPRIEITYSDFNASPSFSDSEFTLNKFLEKKGGKLICRDSYKGYSINNQLND